MRRRLHDIDEVRAEAQRIVERRKSADADLQRNRREVEALLDSLSEYLPAWSALPSVFRLARIETEGGVTSFSENVVLPDVRHELHIVVEMMNFLRAQKGLDDVRMPLLLQPDEIELARERPAPCHCDELRTLAARARSVRTLGRRQSRRWLYLQQDVIDRDKRRCTACGAPKDLHTHELGPDAGWDPAGYVTLCRSCHVVPGGGIEPEAARLAFHLREGEPVDGGSIRSQLGLVFQRGSLHWVVLALGREYVVLKR